MSLTRRALLAAMAAQQRPNILLLLADNWAAPHASALGDPVVKTPVFDRLAREGALFTHAFSPNPSCSPARASLLTGQETHRLRDAANLYGVLADEFPTYASLLRSAGYHVGYSGKGWGPGVAAGGNPAGAVFRTFGDFLTARGAGQPFCYWFGSHDPHVPWALPSSVDRSKIRVPAHLPDHPSVREDVAGYYAEVSQFDTDCGAMIEALRAAGELDNTLVVMTSDNGWQVPRGLAGCYDLGVRIPMAARFPLKVSAGTRREDFVSLMDLAPTFLEAAGVAVPRAATGKSLFGSTRRSAMFLERERHANVRRGDLSYPVRGIRTREYLYLWNIEPERWPAGDPELYWAVGPYGDVDNSLTKQLLLREKPAPYFDLVFGKRPGEELYDVRKDPDQVRNLAGDASYARVLRDLRGRVLRWMKETGDPRAAGPSDFWDKVVYSGPKAAGRRSF